MRNWHRVVIVVAVFASIATSKPKWHIDAHAPPASIDEGSGSIAVIEASHAPEQVRCVASNGGDEPSARVKEVGSRYELACRPGLHFRDAGIMGARSGGCHSSDEPPEDEFIRFVEVRPVKMWRGDAETTVDVVLEDFGRDTIFGSAYVLVDGATVSAMSASLATADPALAAPEVVPWGDNRFEIRVRAHDHDHPRVTVALHAFGWGTCTGECTPGEIHVERER
jgi:hypothetical protein